MITQLRWIKRDYGRETVLQYKYKVATDMPESKWFDVPIEEPELKHKHKITTTCGDTIISIETPDVDGCSHWAKSPS